MGEKDFSEIARLSERLNKDPKSRIFVQLADAYRKSNMIDEALEILNKGLAFHPNYPLAHLILGKCHFDKRQYEQAKESFDKTLSYDPQNIVALRMLAQTCEVTKDEDGQIKAYQGILAIDPFDAPAKEKLAHLESLHGKEPLYTIAMAQEYEKQGNLEKALSIYENLSFATPGDLVLKQKVTELKEKIGGGTEKPGPAKEEIEGLQLDTSLRPEDLNKQAEPEPTKTEEVAPKPTPEPTPAKEQIAEAQPEEFFPNNSEGKPEKLVTKQDAPAEAAQPVETVKETESEEPAGLDLLEPIEPTAPLQDIMPSQQPDEQTATIEPPEAPKEQLAEPEILQPVETVAQPPEPEIETVSEEITGAEDLLQPLESVEKPPVKTEEPETPKPAEIAETVQEATPEHSPAEQPTEALPEIEDLLKPIEEVKEIKEEPVVETTEPSPAPTIEKDKPKTDEPKEQAPPTTRQAETEPTKESTVTETATGQVSDVSQTPTESPFAEPRKKPEEEKPPEEDFQSFKDWLGGLLK
jgi:tetratricopeptide (TPR) repeat protein